MKEASENSASKCKYINTLIGKPNVDGKKERKRERKKKEFMHIKCVVNKIIFGISKNIFVGVYFVGGNKKKKHTKLCEFFFIIPFSLRLCFILSHLCAHHITSHHFILFHIHFIFKPLLLRIWLIKNVIHGIITFLFLYIYLRAHFFRYIFIYWNGNSCEHTYSHCLLLSLCILMSHQRKKKYFLNASIFWYYTYDTHNVMIHT